MTCRISPETSPKARILFLVSGSAAFVASSRAHNVEPELLLRILVFVAPEHEEVLGGRRPALVRRSMLRRRAPAGPSAGMTATASTTTSAGETFRAALGSGGKWGSSSQAERSALVEAVGGSSSSAIRLRRARARAGGRWHRARRGVCGGVRFSIPGNLHVETRYLFPIMSL